MSTQNRSFFRRIDIYFPWLKLVAVLVLGVLMILDLLDLTVPKVGDPYDKIKIAPMSKHVRSTDRVLDGKRLVALTFDDGPSAATTPALLDILAEKDVLATFFMLGMMVRNNPELAVRIEKEGHDAVSHTMYHQNLARISPEAAEADILETKEVFKGVLGHKPSFARPPYGIFDGRVLGIMKTPAVLWSVDAEDWRHRDADAIVSSVMSQIHDGAIILMHDIYASSVEAVPKLVDAAREAGYEFVTVSELAKYRGVDLVAGETYYRLSP